MRLFFRRGVEKVGIESVKESMETLPERGSGIALTEDINRSVKREHEYETKPERGDVPVGLSEGEDGVSGVIAVNVGYPSGADVVESAVDIVLQSDYNEKLDRSELPEHIACRDGRMLSKAVEGDRFVEAENRAGVGKAGSGDEDVGALWESGRAERKSCGDTFKEGHLGILESNFISLRKVDVQGGYTATEDECGADGSTAGVW